MPFYEYQCSRCGHHHEELQKVTDKPLRKCPECGRASLTRLVSAPVFRLKGGGWYETDFKSDKDAKRNLAGEKEPADGKVAEKKEDAKPAAEGKAETKPAPADSKPSATTSRPARVVKAVPRARKPAMAAQGARKAATTKPKARRGRR